MLNITSRMEKNEKIKILIVEDDENIGFIVKDHFESSGYDAYYANNANEAFSLFKDHSPDLCLFDVILPDKTGFELAEEVRKINSTVPIIFLTAQTMKEDIVTGFKLGADDYIRKPFMIDELMLRVEAVLRRISSKPGVISMQTQYYNIGQFEFDYKYQKLKHGDEVNELTHKENELLKLFCDNLNEIVERKAVLKYVWGNDSFFNSRSMDVYIAKLRKYLKADPSIEIKNIRGKGFKMRIND